MSTKITWGSGTALEAKTKTEKQWAAAFEKACELDFKKFEAAFYSGAAGEKIVSVSAPYVITSKKS